MLHGHDHIFDAEDYGGVRYVELPLATDPERLHRSGDAATPYAAGAMANATGFLRGRARGDAGLTLEYVGLNATAGARANGAVLWSLELGAAAAGSP